MSQVYREDLLQAWINECLKNKAYPIEVNVKIEKNGKFTIEYPLDGRQLRKRFILWMSNQFFKQTQVVPPKNKNNSAFNKMWATPLETILRQAVYKGNVDYDTLTPKDKYNTLNGICFNLVLNDTVKKQRDAGLTIADPNSILKIGKDVAATGNHYNRAKVIYDNKKI